MMNEKLCLTCNGEGVMHSGMDYAPSSVCNKCEGSGIASQIAAEVRDNASSLSNTQSAQDGEAVHRTDMTEDEAKAWAWDTLKQDLEPRNWTVGESGTFYGFFTWGWSYRSQYEKQRNPASTVEALRAELTELRRNDASAFEWMRRTAVSLAVAESSDGLLPLSRGLTGWIDRARRSFDGYQDRALKAERELAASQQRVRELEGAICRLRDAPHYEHFAVRLNDAESEALDAMFEAVSGAAPVQAASAERVADMKLSDILPALIAYAGPFDDPRIGWIGTGTSNPDLFKCERCGMEHLDSSKIEHADGCSAAQLLGVLANVRAAIAKQSEGE